MPPSVQRASTVLLPGRRRRCTTRPTSPTAATRSTPTRRWPRRCAELEGASHAQPLRQRAGRAVGAPCWPCCQAGDEVLVVDCIYAPTRRFCDERAEAVRRRPPATAPARATVDEVMALVRPNTRLIVLESPGSLTFEMQDIPAIAAAARARGVTTLIDNTYAAGLLFKPLAPRGRPQRPGADQICRRPFRPVHGLGRHGRQGGRRQAEGRRTATSAGRWRPTTPGACWEGLRTLSARLERHGASGLKVARMGGGPAGGRRGCCTRPARLPRPRPVQARLHRRQRPVQRRS